MRTINRSAFRIILSLTLALPALSSAFGSVRRTDTHEVTKGQEQQEFTSCACGASPVHGFCRLAGVNRGNGKMRFEDRRSPSGKCDMQTCGRIFSYDYAHRCAAYIPGRPVWEQSGPEHVYCSCTGSEDQDGCRIIGMARTDGKVISEWRERPGERAACNATTCGKLLTTDRAAQCEIFLPGPSLVD